MTPLRALAARYSALLKGLAALAVILLVAVALHRMLADIHMHDVRHAFHAIGSGRIAAAIAFTLVSYWMLTFYDVLALKIIGKPLPYSRAALGSFTSYTLSHNLGFGLLTGGSARYRVYSAAGLNDSDIMRVIGIASATFWIGVFVVAAMAMALQPQPLTLFGLTVAAGGERAIGLGLLALILTLLALIARGRVPARLAAASRFRPNGRQLAALIAVSACDLAAATAALLILLPGMGWAMFGHFYLAYALAIIVALITHVPGGLGVFEAVIIAGVAGGDGDRAQLVAALLVYRVVYYFLPLLLAAALVVLLEQRRLHSPIVRAVGITRAVFGEIAPPLLGALTFGGGIVLLVSGALPAKPWRIDILRDVLPLPFVEASHIAASLAGAGLLLLAPGLFRRLDGASVLTRALLLAGAAFSLVKGLDYEEASVLLAIAGLLHLSSHAFYRRTVLTTALWTPQWLSAIAIAVVLSGWMGFFAFKRIDYSQELWWQFAWHGDASRFLRGSFAVALLFLWLAYRHLVSSAGHRAIAENPPAFDVDAIVATSSRTDACLALTGDKRFLLAEAGDAFLMYQVQRNSWIVMGDPVGEERSWAEMLWRMRNMVDVAQGRLMFYQITPDMLPHAIDLGMQVVKYGEEAQVELAAFTMEGPAMRSLRHSVRRAEREGSCFDLISAADLPAHLPELRAVSETWLKAKHGSEKLFSMGHFDSAYLARFDCAVIRSNDRIVAFANVWKAGNKAELSVDLMRLGENIPYGTMDLLFVRLMEWGQAEGYARFNLGIAPLSGLEARRLAPLWAKAGALLYRHGDALYGFEGLRAYKEKFGPTWSPRYVGAPQGLGLLRALVDLQTLIGGSGASAARRRKLTLAA